MERCDLLCRSLPDARNRPVKLRPQTVPYSAGLSYRQRRTRLLQTYSTTDKDALSDNPRVFNRAITLISILSHDQSLVSAGILDLLELRTIAVRLSESQLLPQYVAQPLPACIFDPTIGLRLA